MTDPAQTVRDALTELHLDWAETAPAVFSVTLTGTRKLRTACALEVGSYALGVRAFVARHPDENHAAVYAWLLQHNLKLALVAFSVDSLGDVYLTGRVPLAAVTTELVDTLLGTVAGTADAAFNTILELGFATSIRAEWAWRTARGESTANLTAFAHLVDGP